MSITLIKLLTARYWKFFFSTYFLISLVWVFSISVRVFIRQETISLKVFFLLTLQTLPSILPYIVCLSAMLTILNLGKTKELQLTTLMGVSRARRFLHFLPILILLPLLSFYFNGLLKPYLRKTLKRPELFITNFMLKKLDHGNELNAGAWSLSGDQNGERILIQNQKGHSTILTSQGLRINRQKQLETTQGTLWLNSNKQKEFIQFKTAHIPIQTNKNFSSKETSFFHLNLQNLEHRHHAGLIIRNSFAPIIMLYLGFALGYFGLQIKRGMSFLVCLGSLLLLYFPLHILGRSIKTEHISLQAALLLLPLVACYVLAQFLNRKAEKHGAC